MTGRDLKANRIKLVGDGYGAVKKMAEKLEMNKRTYQRQEAKSGTVYGPISVAVKLLVKQAEIEAENTL